MSTKPEETTTAAETPTTEPAAPDAPLSDAALDGVAGGISVTFNTGGDPCAPTSPGGNIYVPGCS